MSTELTALVVAVRAPQLSCLISVLSTCCVFNFLQPLDEALKTELETALKSFLKQGEKLLLTTKVDPAIIGGMIVSIGDKYVDMSIASKVKKYTDIITAVV